MPDIRFIYQGDKVDLQRESMCKKVCEFLASKINLPKNIEIVFAKMDKSDYGNTIIDGRFPNRINLNDKLIAKEIPYVLVHELIHLNQIKEGLLIAASNNMCIWRGKLYRVDSTIDYKSYTQLPWEQDVNQRYKVLLAETLNSVS